MKKHVFIVFAVAFCALFTACDRPIGVLDTDEMAQVLADVHVTEAAIGQQLVGIEMESKRNYYESIFKKYDITYEEFTRSVEWYSKHPQQFKEVYDITLKLLEQKRDEVEHYVYHPEENPETKVVIDTVNLWLRSSHFTVKANCTDSLCFEFADSTYFAPGDSLVWIFYERVQQDTVRGNLKLRVHYANAEIDSVCSALSQKNRQHRYRVALTLRDTLQPVSIDGCFYQPLDNSRAKVQVDSIKLQLIFDQKKHKISERQKSNLDSLRSTPTSTKRVHTGKKSPVRTEVHGGRPQLLKMKKPNQ